MKTYDTHLLIDKPRLATSHTTGVGSQLASRPANKILSNQLCILQLFPKGNCIGRVYFTTVGFTSGQKEQGVLEGALGHELGALGPALLYSNRQTSIALPYLPHKGRVGVREKLSVICVLL